jgi:hypothetical protein
MKDLLGTKQTCQVIDLGLNFKLVSAVIVNNRAQTVSMQQRISTF